MNKLAVIGAGSWGTALAIAAYNAGSNVIIIARDEDVANEIKKKHHNSKYLKGIKLSEEISASCDLNALIDSQAVLLTIPAQSLPEFLIDNKKVLKNIPAQTPLVVCSKGIEQQNLLLMHTIIQEFFVDNPVLVLSGPNFSDEIAHSLPACATIAGESKQAADKVISLLGSKTFRLYYTDDIIGAQIGGAVKNVLAIACGIAIGGGLGENARAAIVTRGIAEIGRLCTKMGGRLETLMGLSGVGDIMLSCGSAKSRNMALGIEIGKGRDVEELLEISGTVEGVVTAKSVSMLAKKFAIDMPITNAVVEILYNNGNMKSIIKQLLERPFVDEVV